MRTTHPLKWPLCTGIAVALLLLGVWLVPPGWVLPVRPLPAVRSQVPERVPGSWLVLTPPPEIEVVKAVPEPPPQAHQPVPEEFQPADWWLSGAAVRLDAGTTAASPSHNAAARRDSVRRALDLLGVAPDLLSRAQPDSLLADRLKLLRVQEGFRFEELKPYLAALGRAAAYKDIMSRATSMFGDFLQHEIPVTPRTDPDQDPR